MAKSIYEFWVSSGAEKLRLPVLPSFLDISTPTQNESVNISGLGEITIIQDPMAKTFNFASLFVRHETPITEYSGFPLPWDCIKLIEKWKKAKKPIRFIVTGTPINYAVSIEDFSYREGDSGVGVMDYSLTLKEYRYPTPKVVSTASTNGTKPSSKTKVRPETKDTSKTRAYTVKSGDSLWAIARKEYTDGDKWKKIWEANKEQLIKQDSRNIKKPGNYIQPGTKLVIPK